MAQQRGMTSYITMGRETTPGTAATTGFILPFSTCDVTKKVARNSPSTIRGRVDAAKPFKGNTDVNGNLVVPIDTASAWYYFDMIFNNGTTGWAQTGTNPYTHAFTIENTKPYFTLEKAFPDVTEFMRSVGCKAGGLQFSLGGDGELLMTIPIVGMDENMYASSFDAAPTTVSQGDVYANFQAAVQIDTVASTRVKMLDINVDFGLDTTQRIISGGGILGSIPEGEAKVTGRITTIFDNDEFLDYADGDTEVNMTVILTPTTAAHTLTIDIEELQFSYESPPISGPQGVDVTLDFVGYYDNGSNDSIIMIELINGTDHS